MAEFSTLAICASLSQIKLTLLENETAQNEKLESKKFVSFQSHLITKSLGKHIDDIPQAALLNISFI